ncbi:hypothetical protein D9M69_175290 [compost metagenome]
MSMPRASAASHSAGGSAEPPMMIFHPDRSGLPSADACNSICRMVGTQCENVTFSVSRSFSSWSGT